MESVTANFIESANAISMTMVIASMKHSPITLNIANIITPHIMLGGRIVIGRANGQNRPPFVVIALIEQVRHSQDPLVRSPDCPQYALVPEQIR